MTNIQKVKYSKGKIPEALQRMSVHIVQGKRVVHL